jgi:regulatory protein
MLARREYSRAALASRLAAKGAAPDEVERLLDELAALGYLSDARFAHAVVTQKAGRFSRRAITESLKAAGVSAAAAEDALAEHTLADDEALAALWRRRFGRPPRDDREKARQVRFLQSRGFSLAAILRLLRHLPDEPDAAA